MLFAGGEMTRPQWLLVAFIGVVASIAYIRSDQIARRLNSGIYRAPSTWTA